jgi:2-methylcitrate dehydratase PrpD
MSLQYGVASALLYGRVDEETYVQFDDKKIQRLISRCRIETDSVYNRSFAKGLQPARIEVRLAVGEVYRASLPEVPWLQGGAVIARFRHKAAAVLAPSNVEEIVRSSEVLWDLEDCSSLFKVFASSTVKT